jgi:putative FmdB family regulatory protein
MPLYAYQCQKCHNHFDMFFPLKEWDITPECPDCGGQGDKILTAQIKRSEPVWLDDSVRGALQDTDDPNTRPIENRSDYNRYLKDNGIIER